MSQIFDIRLSLNFMTKSGRFWLFFHEYSSSFHKIKTRPKIKYLRDISLYMNVFYK